MINDRVMHLMWKPSLLWVNCEANDLMVFHLSLSFSLPLFLSLSLSLSPSSSPSPSLFLLTDTVNFLGISIVGQTSEDGAGGIFVGSVMKG